MSYWKENINYRQEKTSNGIRYLITIDFVDVEVTEKVYKAYTQMERRERYLVEAEEGIVISLEQLIDDEVKVECLSNEYVESAEETVIRAEEDSEKAELLSMLPDAIAKLTADEQKLITALYFNNISAREYARRHNISDMAVRKKRDRILKKISTFFV